MLQLSDTDRAKVAALRSIPGKQVAEVVRIDWPSPTGVRFYAVAALHELTPSIPVSPVEPRLVPDDPDSPELFLKIDQQSALADQDIDLKVSDLDGSMADLAFQYGEGVKVEIFYWFAQVNLLLSQWLGHLKRPKDADSQFFTAAASNGFRSPQLNLPRRGIGFPECQAVYGVQLPTLEEIADNDCPVNYHLPGGTIGILVDGQVQQTCSRASRPVCIAHIGDALSFLGVDTVVQPIPNNQTHGPNLQAASVGNESNLKDPLQVIFGARWVRDTDPWQYRPEADNNNPDQGFVSVLIPVCEGPIESMTQVAVNNALIAFMHLNTRNGTRRQSPTSYAPDVSNYSGTALFFARYGQVNPANYNASNLKGSCYVIGLNNIRVYTDATTFTETLSFNRAWCLLECLRNKRWGYGVDVARFVIADWIDVGIWSAKIVTFVDLNGDTHSCARSNFNAALQGRTTQQQINDICLAGRLGLPFTFQGKDRIVALQKEEDLDSAPLFTDYGDQRNIAVDDDGKALLKRSQVSDDTLPNSIILTFEDAAQNNVERPLTFMSQPQQLLAGQASGDNTRRVIEKKYSAVGVTTYEEAVRLGTLLLDLGEFDSGGLQNNLSITFTTFFPETLELHRYKVIRVQSRQLERYGFEYFRVMDMNRTSDLKVEITAQAYPVDYYENFETEADTGGTTPDGNIYEAEAEANTLGDGANVADDPDCSNGQKVTGVGLLQFNGVNVDQDGRYIIFIDYKAGTDTNANVSVNGGSPLVQTFPAGDGVVRIFMIRDLTAGDNTILFTKADSAGPELDRIIVRFDPIIVGGGGTCRPEFGSISYGNSQMVMPIQPC